MFGKIPCSAPMLSLLEPTMIQGVVEEPAFTIGKQYHVENRVRIVNANEKQIISTVHGQTNLHEQTIRLEGSLLMANCSCPLDEQPFCRHCVAALLEYQRWAQQNISHNHERRADPAAPQAQGAPTSPLGIQLHEISLFINWLQETHSNLHHRKDIPPPPSFQSADVLAWVEMIQNLGEERRRSEERQGILEADLNTREEQLDRLSHQYQTSCQDLKKAQESCQALQKQVEHYRERLHKLTEIAKELTRLEEQTKTLAADVLKKGSQLESHGPAIRKLSSTLQDLVDRPSS